MGVTIYTVLLQTIMLLANGAGIRGLLYQLKTLPALVLPLGICKRPVPEDLTSPMIGLL